MKITSQHRAPKAGFTLIELLTVIAIIAILMGLLFPAVNAVKEAAKKAEAKTACMGIVAAVKQYNSEYGKYPPLESPAGTTDTIVGGIAKEKNADKTIVSKSKGGNKILFDTLRAIDTDLNKDHVMNPRKIVFFEGKSVNDPTNPKSGFVDKQDSSDRGCYFDPWGAQYAVIIDCDYDNILSVDFIYSEWTTTERPRTGVGAMSLGKDNKIGDKTTSGKYKSGTAFSDDVISWQ